MNDAVYLLLLVLLVASAVAAVSVRGLTHAVVVLSIFSVVLTLVFAFLQAVDVAMAEAVIGAGMMTALFIGALGRLGAPS